MKTMMISLLAFAVTALAAPAVAGGSCCSSPPSTSATACTVGESQMEIHAASTAAMEGVDMPVAVGHSAAMAELLAADQIEGVADHAMGMRSALGLDKLSSSKNDGQESHEAGISSELMILGDRDISIEDARTSFLRLQESFIPLAAASYEGGENSPEWAIYNCGMIKGSWIQPEGKVANPYYGSKMLRCGSKVAALGAAQEEPAHEEHSDSGHSH